MVGSSSTHSSQFIGGTLDAMALGSVHWACRGTRGATLCCSGAVVLLLSTNPLCTVTGAGALGGALMHRSK